jgi:hypothetical protein
MRKIIFVCGTVALICATIDVARADWQYTKWGMTPDQVVSASNGSASIVPPNGGCPVQGTYKSGSQVFSMSACFDNNGLNQIELDMENATPSDAQQILAALTAKYGNPTPGDNPTAYQWTDLGSDNQIILWDFSLSGRVLIFYKPTLTGNGL